MLQRQMASLSSLGGGSVGTETSAGSGTQTALRALEDEVSRLRSELASVSVRLEGRGRKPEPLPAYEE